ncbi:alpha/beta fold hydrolase [Kocuria sp. M1R5S2]|uniref:alpha/beta fold hydrolase n=1 Tax=Kocuria rhizosphaerae TaxID=3376285 RepID=UPI0037A8940A
MPGIHVEHWGDGPPVLLVHGSITGGAGTWSAQRPLAEHWRLMVVDRRGYFPNPLAEVEDFEVDAGDVAELLTEPVHLVGHSYGGVVALLAAADHPAMVRSLTVNEPPAFGLVPDDPVVGDYVRGMRELWDHGPADPTAFLHAFIAYVGSTFTPPDPLSPDLLQNAHMLRHERLTDEARIPLAALRRQAPFPKLVVSGGHSRVFDAVCDVLERDLGAQRAVVPGAGHSVQRTGVPYNEVLHRFLSAVV